MKSVGKVYRVAASIFTNKLRVETQPGDGGGGGGGWEGQQRYVLNRMQVLNAEVASAKRHACK